MYTLLLLFFTLTFSDEGPGICPNGHSAFTYSDSGPGADPDGSHVTSVDDGIGIDPNGRATVSGSACRDYTACIDPNG